MNLGKCAHTSLLRGRPSPRQPDLKYDDRGEIPWLPPHQPYTYLGVELTATLNSADDVSAAATKMRKRAEAVVDSSASIRQKLMILGGNVVAAAAYKLAGANLTPAAAARLDRIVAGYAKRTWRCPNSVASHFMFLPRDLHGMGVQSLREALGKTYPRLMLDSLRDPDSLGRMTAGLVEEHLRRAYSPGIGGGMDLHPAYRSTKPTANLLRSIGAIRMSLVGVTPPQGAGELTGGSGPRTKGSRGR